jgi:cobalt/nickel transport system ATP-binding protein
VIELRDVSYAFPGGAPVLRGLSLRVAAGEKVAVLGANGSGKTTLLRVAAGLAFPQAGEVLWRGEPLTPDRLRERAFRRALRRDVGFLFQNAAAMLFHGTVREEIAFGPRQRGDLDGAAIDSAAALWAERCRVDALLDRPPHLLSAGEQKRVALAAVLAVEPEVLLLDEPTANLDPRSTGWLIDLLLDDPRTLVLTTHNVGLARELGERAVVLSEDHRIVHDGDFESLRGDHGKLLAANLLHTHRHRHDGREHRHWHEHDWD